MTQSFRFLRRAFAASLAVLMLLSTGCANRTSPVIAEASYPEMAAYPDESKFINKVTGEFDSDGFSQVYDAWRQDQQRQRNQPEGYTTGLPTFFCRSIPVFLSGGQGNPVCSPLNLYLALALLAEASAGNSRQQILDTVGIGDLQALRTQAGQVWNAHYCTDGANTSILANSLWLEQGLAYDKATVRTLSEDYYTSVFQGAFGSEEMTQSFRDWLNQQTGGLLEEQVQGLEMSPQTVMALASTILYRAKWHTEFAEELSKPGTFHGPRGDREVTFMNRELSYGPYYWGGDFAAVSLPLEDSSNLWLVLPDEGKSPEEILESGLALDMILTNHLEYENQERVRVKLSLPKFDITADTQMQEAFRSLGITEVFQPETADFSSLLPEDPAWLDRVQHAARVTIDEEGVSAAAYTAMMFAGAARPPEDEVDFILDRPFLFVITSHDDLPLFAGIVNEP